MRKGICFMNYRDGAYLSMIEWPYRVAGDAPGMGYNGPKFSPSSVDP
jgi:hypothetical protein